MNTFFKMISLVTFFVVFSVSNVSALTIDTTSGWTGSVNNGWYGSGQSLTVDSVENHFDSIGFYFDSESWGRTFDFTLSDSLNGGSTLFSTSFVVSDGLSTINIDQDVIANSIVYALIDYRGFTGRTAHYENNIYDGGNSSFGSIGSQLAYFGLDHRFVAEFSEGSAPVPEPSTIILLGSGLTGLVLLRRRKS